jgi:rhodanese-related sulfurtransferase
LTSPGTDSARLSVEELKDRLERGEPMVVLDVREDRERAHAAIPVPPSAHDLHIPIGEIAACLDEIRATVGSMPLVVYCHHGVRSKAVADWLTAQGLSDVSDVEDGIDAWSLRIDRTVRRY